MVVAATVDAQVEAAKREIKRAIERGLSFWPITTSLRNQLFAFGVPQEQISEAMEEIGRFVRQIRLNEARRQYDLACQGNWPGPHLQAMEALLALIGAVAADIGISEEDIEGLRQRTRLVEVKHGWQGRIEDAARAIKAMEAFLDSFPPGVPLASLGPPDPRQLVSTLKSTIAEAAIQAGQLILF